MMFARFLFLSGYIIKVDKHICVFMQYNDDSAILHKWTIPG